MTPPGSQIALDAQKMLKEEEVGVVSLILSGGQGTVAENNRDSRDANL